MTTTRRQFIQSSAAALAVASPLAFPSLVRADSAKEFRLGLITPAGHSWNRAALQFGEALKKETNGRLSVTVFHSGQLGNEAAMMQQMQSGALDMGWIQAAELGSRVSSVAAINAPYLVRSTPAVAKLVKTPQALKLLEVLPRETGTIGLGWGITGMRAVFATKDVTVPTDLKGMKLRINPTPVYRDFYQMLGAAPTPIPTPQVFDAMSNGQVDGLEADIEFSWNQRFDKVAKSLLQMNALFMPFAPLVSGRIWQGLDAKDRELIRRLVAQSLDAQINDIVTTEAGLIEKFKAARSAPPCNHAPAVRAPPGPRPTFLPHRHGHPYLSALAAQRPFAPETRWPHQRPVDQRSQPLRRARPGHRLALLANVANLGPQDAQAAIAAANAAWPAWRAKTAKERSILLRKWYRPAHGSTRTTSGRIMTAEQGKPLP
jgi:TRAP-type C4-dicarboxylate transport system substrate-binding protein